MSGMKRVYEEVVQVEHEIAEIEDRIEHIRNTEPGSIDRSLKLAEIQIELGQRAKRLIDLDESLRQED